MKILFPILALAMLTGCGNPSTNHLQRVETSLGTFHSFSSFSSPNGYIVTTDSGRYAFTNFDAGLIEKTAGAHGNVERVTYMEGGAIADDYLRLNLLLIAVDNFRSVTE